MAILIFVVCISVSIYYACIKNEKNKSLNEKNPSVKHEIEPIKKIDENHNIEPKKDIRLTHIKNIELEKVTDSGIPQNIDEITNNQYEVLKRLQGANIKYALTGIINTYHNNLRELLKQFKNLELIRYSNLEEAIQKMTTKELKEYLRSKHLKLTGNKKDLIERLKPELKEDEINKIKIKNKSYELTDKGKELLQTYKKAKEKEFENMFSKAISLFEKREFKEGYRMICKYNCQYCNIVGINFEWHEELRKGLEENDENILKYFLDKEIKLNNDMQIDTFKSIICFTVLSGKTYNAITGIVKKVYHYDIDIYEIQYYCSLINNEKEARDMENLGIEYYEILGDDSSCSKCKTKIEKKLKLSERKQGVNFPPLCKKCRCSIVAYFDD